MTSFQIKAAMVAVEHTRALRRLGVLVNLTDKQTWDAAYATATSSPTLDDALLDLASRMKADADAIVQFVLDQPKVTP